MAEPQPKVRLNSGEYWQGDHKFRIRDFRLCHRSSLTFSKTTESQLRYSQFKKHLRQLFFSHQTGKISFSFSKSITSFMNYYFILLKGHMQSTNLNERFMQ